MGLALGANERLSVLALGAHADDIEIGAGGLILELLETGRIAELTWVVFSAEGPRASEAKASAETLIAGRAPLNVEVAAFRERYFPYEPAIKEMFDTLGTRLRPDLVISPRLEDLHQDHRTVAEVAWQTFRASLILEYEIPKYEGDLGHPNLYVSLSAVTLDRKIDHLMTAFPSQLERSWYSADTFRGLARIRGIEAAASSQFAEGFTCRKAVLQVPALTR
jgi:LmbE family N-acetylglucosaminyl deacetylase